MIKLPLRLETIASLVPKGTQLADLGCDQLLLAQFLIEKEWVKRVIAIDVSPKVIIKAQSKIKQLDLTSKIDLRCGDGLIPLKVGEVETLVIAGLGHYKIIEILKRDQKQLKGIDNLIIQSNTKVPHIRQYLTTHGFYIEAEKMIKEGSHYYIVILFKRGKRKYKKHDLILGPCLRQEKSSTWQQYLAQEKEQQQKLLAVIPFWYINKRWQRRRYSRLLSKELR